MKLIIEETLKQYREMFKLTENREDYFRYIISKPFKKVFDILNIPLKASEPGGYDIIRASKMMGLLDVNQTEKGKEALDLLERANVMEVATTTLSTCFEYIKDYDLKIDAQELMFGINLGDPESLALQKGYSGFGGIPGFILLTIFPNDYNLLRLPALIAHEFHHNLRFSYTNWSHGDVTVGEYLVIEGLADSFASKLYGEELLGPWVSSFPKEDLASSKRIIKKALNVKGFAEVSSYLFGDEVSLQHGYQPVGLPPFAGYAVGYKLVQAFMKQTGKNILEATLLDADEIFQQVNFFNCR